jgi:hypothetical protein
MTFPHTGNTNYKNVPKNLPLIFFVLLLLLLRLLLFAVVLLLLPGLLFVRFHFVVRHFLVALAFGGPVSPRHGEKRRDAYER